eukprot:CAMPEP_0206459210 /NCGR_PEP_ID=MMETSP0324_2-20121206/24042_1 /ASSEMBLY_ACC=CAM_ASM_000836 /TAXON_ID=2866 /ORGANISM="Crypthecodinium cohnii, Strain Seligo" /LENGTH=572 /DNA_ID=CAMNT_0053930721 /DNA_START=257 /DNA_END=1975 /DNA_ORIENTATION=+
MSFTFAAASKLPKFTKALLAAFLLLILQVSGEAVPSAAAAQSEGQGQGSSLPLDSESHSLSLEVEQFRKASAVLRPLLGVLPKNEEGKLGDSAVKYALHHFFVRKFAWHVRGLDSAGQSWNQTTLLDVPILKDLPEETRSLFQERLKSGGLTEHECTVLAVTIWQLIHQKSEVQLLKTFHFFDLHTSDTLDSAKATQVVGAYMAAFVLDRDISKVVPAKMMQVLGKMDKVYPRWPGLQRIIQQEVSVEQARRGSDVLRYSSINRIRENVDERFGYWQVPECIELKDLLLSKEDHGTGRIRLADFYKAGLDGNFQFRESAEWLRELGALEEASSYSGGEPRVIIENYISGASNSIGSSPYHDSRCISECENLMETIQLRFSSPSAQPEELSSFVSTLPSRTMKAPRDLGTVQRQRLNSIAEENGGAVPLTGRLFAQWMHHSYPRECPYPHLAGSTNPHIYTKITEIRKGISSKEQMTSIAAQKPRQDAPILTAPWQPGEELPAPIQSANSEPPRFLMQLHLLLLLAVFACSAFSVAKLACRACRGRRADKVNRQPLPPGVGGLGQQHQPQLAV